MTELYPHQREGAEWLRETDRGILAWEPGTGKTFAAIEAAVTPTLVVCPAYLLWNWQEAYSDVCPEYAVCVPQGTPAQKHSQITTTLECGDVVIISYNLLADQYPEIMNTRWGTVIFDEAHNLRGRATKRTKAAQKLHAMSTYMLTGTPIKKDAGDYFPLLRLCNPKAFTSYWRFIQENCYTKETPWSTEIGDVRDPAGFQRVLEPYVQHLALADVFADIPDAVWTNVPTLLMPKETADHKKIKKEYRDPNGAPLSGAGAVMPELRRLTASSKNKIAATRELLADHDDEKVIVWTWYRESAQVVNECCVADHRPRFIATGDLSPLRRADVIRQWLETDNGVLIATLSSVGEGYNLQDSRVAIFYEMDYLPSTNLQALARQRRHGQTDTVRAYAIIARGSIDAAIAKVAQRRDTEHSRAQGLDGVLTELMRSA